MDKTWERFLEFRELVFRGIEGVLATDEGVHKSYEGGIDISFPNYFQEKEGKAKITLTLHCYVLGPFRHYSWEGETLDEVLEEAFEDVQKWIDESRGDIEDDG